MQGHVGKPGDGGNNSTIADAPEGKTRDLAAKAASFGTNQLIDILGADLFLFTLRLTMQAQTKNAHTVQPNTTSSNLSYGDHWTVVIWVLAFAAIVAGAYLLQFGSAKFSAEPEHWGQLGDYFGGLLNPAVALAALMLLAWSISLQRKELLETRRQLEIAATAQHQQVRLSALTGLVNALTEELHMHRAHLQYLTSQIGQQKVSYESFTQRAVANSLSQAERIMAQTMAPGIDTLFPILDLDGNTLSAKKALVKVAALNKRVDEVTLQRFRHQDAILKMLETSSGS